MKRLALILIATFVSTAWAVSPATWSHSTEADLADGEFDSTVINSRGQISLARKLEVLMSAERAPAVVSALAVMGESVFVASGSSNEVFVLEEGSEARLFSSPPGTMIASLAVVDSSLLAGTGGEQAGIYHLDSQGQPQTVWTDESVQYVWAIVPGEGDVVYAATGPEGKVFAVNSDGDADLLFEAGELAKNILCLTLSAEGMLYAGTDEEGLVIEIDLERKSSRVILDTEEAEISALLADSEGGLFVATSDTAKADSGGDEAPSEDKAGRAPETQPLDAPEIHPATESTDDESEEADAQDQPDSAGQIQRVQAVAGRPAVEIVNEAVFAVMEGGATGDLVLVEITEPGEKGESADSGPTIPDEGQSVPAQFFGDEGPDEMPMPPGMRPGRPVRRRGGPQGGKGKGNAVYYVQADGLVRTIFRRPVTILAMAAYDGELILGTGNGGDIYTVTTDGDQIARVANTDARQVTALLAGEAGRMLFATANKGSVGRIESEFAAEGTYICEPLDAGQIAGWGTAMARTDVRAGATLTFATRSGNLAEPDDATWSDWSAETALDDGFLKIASQPARFLQYRLTFGSDGAGTALAEDLELIYQVGNLRPEVAAVTVKPSDKPGQGGGPPRKDSGPRMYRQIQIKATDPNGDKLTFKIEFRQIGTAAWVSLSDDLAQPKFVWDTRDVNDGIYQLRVTVSDSPANPPATTLEGVRLSEPVIVDNTNPAILDLMAQAVDGEYQVAGLVVEETSRIVSMHYSVDSQDEWVAILPDDGIADSQVEAFALRLTDLEPGPHRLAVRVKDLFDNTGYASLIITVPAE